MTNMAGSKMGRKDKNDKINENNKKTDSLIFFTYIHNVITFRVIKEPVVKESQFSVGSSHRMSTGG